MHHVAGLKYWWLYYVILRYISLPIRDKILNSGWHTDARTHTRPTTTFLFLFLQNYKKKTIYYVSNPLFDHSYAHFHDRCLPSCCVRQNGIDHLWLSITPAGQFLVRFGGLSMRLLCFINRSSGTSSLQVYIMWILLEYDQHPQTENCKRC